MNDETSVGRKNVKSFDAEGALRAELLGKVLAAQADVEAQLAELQRMSGDARLVAECSSQLSALYALQSNISTAAPGTLTGLRSEVVSSIAAASTTAQQARTAAAGSAAAESTQLVAASAATRSEVQALAKDLFERRIFDKYLTFDPPEEEEAYRRCEAENRRYSAEQLARNTAEGNLNAAGAAMGQMLDAHAHGAGKSPDFLPRWNQLVDTTHRQRDVMRSEGKSTEEFDRRLAEDVRRFLKAKGIPEAEIEARLAASSTPDTARVVLLAGLHRLPDLRGAGSHCRSCRRRTWHPHAADTQASEGDLPHGADTA